MNSAVYARKSDAAGDTRKDKVPFELGIPVSNFHPHCRNVADIEAYQNAQARESLEHHIDGLVIKINLTKSWDTGKAPRFAIAFKFPAVEATTVVEDIVLQMDDRVVTPVAQLRPVLIDGFCLQSYTS